MSASDPTNEGEKLSRGEAETLCILHAVGARGCGAADLAARLGISPTLSAPVARAAEPLADVGLLANTEGRLSLTDTGREWMAERLAAVGLG